MCLVQDLYISNLILCKLNFGCVQNFKFVTQFNNPI